VLPGPVEVRREILDAQTHWMVGHRSADFSELFARVQGKLRQVFFTANPVIVSTSSGTGLWEGASRNAIRDDRRALHLVNGAFSERWAKVSQANGKEIDVIEVPWGQAITPERVAEMLAAGRYDAVCVVHNETSTGVINPLREIAEVVRRHDDTLLMVDCVSSFLGAELRVDDWGIDVALTSSQKAFALPPGLSFAALGPRVLERARQVPHRGYYFDFLELVAGVEKNNTPSTPAISLIYAADCQLDDILAEGLENRWARHLRLRDSTHEWAARHGFDLFAPPGFRSPTVTAVANNRDVDTRAMAAFMRERGFAIDTGYGKLKGQTFRIAHMGDMSESMLQDILGGLSAFVGGQ
jgi:predicted phosphoserine aminotransferase